MMFNLSKRLIRIVLPLVVITATFIYFISINIPPAPSSSHVSHITPTPTPITIQETRPTVVNIALTTVDQQNHLTSQAPITFSNGSHLLPQTEITVDDHTTYQHMLGFGASLTGSTVWELEHELTQQQRDALMKQFFDPVHGLGISLLRQPVGASDQDAPGETTPSQYCSYDDNYGVPDTNLSHFSIQHDITAHTINLLQQAMRFNPQLHIIAAPWCIPRWMLTYVGGYRTLNPAYYSLYAQYLVKFIQAYNAKTQHVPIWGIIPQNEPLYSYANFGNNMTANQQSTFIANNLGPMLVQNNLHTEILTYDHNWDHPEYPEQVLASPAAKYVVGTSWHQYAGDVTAQTVVHNMFPSKGTFFTEDSPPPFDTNWARYMPEAANRILDILDNWSESYIQWTLASNTQLGPGVCSCGADVYVNDTNGTVTYSLAYYLLGQFSKYVKAQAYRIASTDQGTGKIRSTAFKNPDGSIALVAYNDSSTSQIFAVNWAGKTFTYALPSNAIATFTWSTK